jgi:hypothetical protein
VRAFLVVMLDVGAQYVFEVAAAKDKQPVETLVADGATRLRAPAHSRSEHGFEVSSCLPLRQLRTPCSPLPLADRRCGFG